MNQYTKMRKAAKLSIRQAAKQSGVAFSTIQGIEQGAKPRPSTVEKLEAAYLKEQFQTSIRKVRELKPLKKAPTISVGTDLYTKKELDAAITWVMWTFLVYGILLGAVAAWVVSLVW